MTVSNDVNKAGPFVGDNSNTTFAITYKVFAATDLLVYWLDADGIESTLVYGADYIVTLNSDQNASPGGSVTYPADPGSDPTRLTALEYLTILREVDETQESDIANLGGFYPDIIENMADRAVMMAQQNAEKIIRSELRSAAAIQANADNIANLTANDPGGSYALILDLRSADNGKGASQIGIEDVGSDFTATSVEGALDELVADIDAKDAISVAGIATNAADIVTNAAAIALITSSGSFTPVHSGFSSAPTGDIRWKKVGNVVTLQCDFSVGTSDSLFWGITNWPAELQCTEEVKVPIFGYVDNTVNVNALGALVIGTSLPGNPEVVTFYSSMLGGGWTATASSKGLIPTSYGPSQIMYTIY